jgi:HK97 family phage portal protein
MEGDWRGRILSHTEKSSFFLFLHDIIFMAIFDLFKRAKTRLKEVRLFNAGNTAVTEELPFYADWFYNAKFGIPRRVNLVEVRQYAKSPWVQMVVNAILKQVMTTKWDVVSSDEEDETDYSSDVEKTKTFLNYPNRNGDDFWGVWVPFLRDVLEIDSGTVFKGRNAGGELVELFAYDGGRFLISVDEHGILENYWQYSFRYPSNAPLLVEKEDLVYGKVNVNSEMQPYGWSPLQSILQEVELLIQSTRWNKEFYRNSAVPDGLINVEMEKDELDKLKSTWKQEMKGKAHKLAFVDSKTLNFTSMIKSNRDMEWLEGSKWYFHTVFGAYGLSPQEVGFFEKSSRATGESQERITIRNAIKPYLALVERKINREILPELVGHDNIKFKWFPKDDASEKIEHEQNMDELDKGALTINEYRKIKGRDSVGWGDEPMKQASPFGFGENPGGGMPDEPESPEDVDEDREGREESRKIYVKLLSGFLRNGERG